MPRLSALAFSMGTYGLIRGVSTVDVVKIFEASDSITFPNQVTEVEYLIVAGGGSGGICSTHDRSGGGGGGAGGVRLGSGFPVDGGETYVVQVGGGGARSSGLDVGGGGTFNGLPNGIAGLGGFNSFLQGGSPTVVHIGANGGGAGGSQKNGGTNARPGGSGGGGANPATAAGAAIAISPANGHADPSAYSGVSQSSPFPVQGHAGGANNPGTAPAGPGVHIIAGGGGGAGGAGQQGGSPGASHPAPTVGLGGNAITSDITGTSKFYGAGGSGGAGGYPGDSAEQGQVGPGQLSMVDGVGGKGSTSGYFSGGTTSGTLDAAEATGSGGGGANAAWPSNSNRSFSGAGAGGVVVLKYRAPRQSVIFIISSTKNVTVPTGASTMDYLVCSGGGGTGASGFVGGGGGGGVRLGTGYPVTSGEVYTVVTGVGGAGASGPVTENSSGDNGGDSYIYKSSPSNSFVIGSNGGGSSNPQGGSGGTRPAGNAGGCGAGGSAAGYTEGDGDTGTTNSIITGENSVSNSTPGARVDPITPFGAIKQGYGGGVGGGHPTINTPEASGGGGGAGGPGGNAKAVGDGLGGDGGIALVSEISGFSRGYGGGGGGGDKYNSLTLNSDGSITVGNARTGGNGGGIGPANHPTAAGNPVLRGGGGFGTSDVTAVRSNGEASTGGGAGGTGENGGTGGSHGGSGVVIIKFNF